MTSKHLVRILFVVLAMLVLVACATPTPTPVPPTAVPATKPPQPTQVPPTATTAPASSAASPAAPQPTATTRPTDVPKPAVRTKANPGEKITLYHLGDVTGPYAAITTPLVTGFSDGAKYINSKGGIYGAEIAVEWSDTANKLELAISAYNRFREKKPLLMQLYGSTETEGLRDRLAQDKIPVLTAGVSAKGSYPASYVFAVVPIYSDQFGLFLDWLKANWEKAKPAKGQALDSPKVAVLTWDSAFGRAALTDETKAYAEKLGIKVMALEFFAMGAPDVTTQILAAKKAGANVIYTNSLAHGPAQILKDAVSLGVRDEFLIGGCNWTMDTSMLGLAGAASEGFYGVLPNQWWDEVDQPGIKLVTEQFNANGRKPAERSVGYLLAFYFVDAMKQYIEKTIDRVGFDALSGEAVYQTMISTPIKLGQGVTSFDYNKDLRATTKARIAQVKGGKFVFLTDWMTAPA